MDPFTIAGLAATGVSALGNLFGKSDEEERQARFADYLRMVKALKSEAVRRTSRQVGGYVKQATAGAGRRAIASGRAGDIEAYTIPAQTAAIRQGAQAVEQAGAAYDQPMIAGARDFYNRPISRGGLGEFLGTVGPLMAQYGLGREGIQAQAEDVTGGYNAGGAYSINPDVEAEINAYRRRRSTMSLGGNY